MSKVKHLDLEDDPEILKVQEKQKKLQDEKQAKILNKKEKKKIYEDEIKAYENSLISKSAVKRSPIQTAELIKAEKNRWLQRKQQKQIYVNFTSKIDEDINPNHINRLKPYEKWITEPKVIELETKIVTDSKRGVWNRFSETHFTKTQSASIIPYKLPQTISKPSVSTHNTSQVSYIQKMMLK